MNKPQKNQIVTLSIGGYSSEGDGIARLDGMAVFVKGALRGEECRVRLLKVGKTAAWGKVEQVIKPSSERITPDCPHYPKCGGCALRHMTYGEELQMKRQRVEDALRRIGGLDISVDTIHGASDPARYRNKAQFPVSSKDGVSVGFYRARSHDVIDVASCLLQQEAADAAGRAVKEWMVRYQIPAYDEVSHTGLIRHVYARTNRKGESLVCLLCNGEKLPHERELTDELRLAVPGTVGIVLGINTEKTNVILGKSYRTLWGQDHLYDTLCGLSFKLSVPSFFQVNPAQTEVLYAKAAEFAGLTGVETVVDLYCGTGTISLVLAKNAGQVIGAEIVPSAIEDAKENARRNGLGNAEFICADAKEAAAELVRRDLRPDVISVDPPRKGMAPEVIGHIVSMQPKRVVYVSCDPATLARDCKRFGELGYVTVKAEAVDMFPRTHHVETVALLCREQTVHEMSLHPSPFEMISSGKKTIELRLFDEKRSRIKAGDIITFINTANGKKLSRTVRKLHRFDSFDELYRSLPLLQCGYTAENVAGAHPSDMEQYYSAERQSRYGVVGIELFPS